MANKKVTELPENTSWNDNDKYYVVTPEGVSKCIRGATIKAAILEDVDTSTGGRNSYKGRYTTEANLLLAHPNDAEDRTAGDYAQVGETNSYWERDPETLEWFDTGDVIDDVELDEYPTLGNNDRAATSGGTKELLDGKASSVHTHSLAETWLTDILANYLLSSNFNSVFWTALKAALIQGSGVTLTKNETTKTVTINAIGGDGEPITIEGIVIDESGNAVSSDAVYEFATELSGYTDIPFAENVTLACGNSSSPKFSTTGATGDFAIDAITTSRGDADINDDVALQIPYRIVLAVASLNLSLPTSVKDHRERDIAGNFITIEGEIGEAVTLWFEKRGAIWAMWDDSEGEEGTIGLPIEISDVTGLQGELDDLQSQIDAIEVGSGATNLGANATPTTVVITSDTGDDATIGAADSTNAGLMLPAEKTKLTGIASGATANDTDANLKNRANHTGTQAASTITQDSTHRFVTDAEKTTWNAKEEVSYEVGRAWDDEILFDKREVTVAPTVLTTNVNYTVAASGNLTRPCVQRHVIETDGTHQIFFSPQFNFRNNIASGDTLEAGTYTLWFFWDGEGNVEVTLPGGAYIESDLVPPVLSSVSVSNVGGYIATLNYTISEEGTIYWAVYPTATAQQTKSAIEAGTGAVAFGSYVSPAGAQGIAVAPLAVSTAYKVHYFAKDLALNESAAAMTSEFTTLSAINYGMLSNVQLILDDIGLAVGTDNSYGTVDGSGNVTLWKSLAPGPTGRNFAVNGTGVTLSSGVAFGGSGSLRNTDRTWTKFMHYNASGIASLKFTVHAIVKFGIVSDPNANISLFGNNGISSSNIGIQIGYEDRVANSANNALSFIISNGSLGSQIHKAFLNTGPTYNNNIITPNQDLLFTLEFDGSLPAAFRLKLFINGVQQTLTAQESLSTTLNSANSTYDLELSAGGNAALRDRTTQRTIVLQSGLQTATDRNYFMKELKAKYGIV